jgi:allantoinase
MYGAPDAVVDFCCIRSTQAAACGSSMSDFDLVIQGRIAEAHGVVDEGWIAVRDGIVAARGIGKPPSAQERVDARGQWVLPGVVDGQVHSGSQAAQEGLGWASRAAAAGGVTVMVDMPYDDPQPVATASQLVAKADQVNRECHVDVALYATISAEGGLTAIPGLIDAGACAFKFSTFEAAPGRFPRIEEDDLADAFRVIAASGLACGVHNQMQELTRKNLRRSVAAGDTGWDAYLRAHPPLVEDLATVIVYELGAQTGARAHVVHVSTARGFELCEMYRRGGHRASIETCVQYLMLNHEEHTRRFGAKTKHYPPIRPRAEVERLWQHLVAGHCTFVSSDHVSWGLERKENPNIFRNSSGGPGLETLLPAFWTGCEARGLKAPFVVQQLCANPAAHFLLDDRKGSLAPGMDADIVILDPQQYRFDPSKSLSAVTWSSFEGMQMSAKVVTTFSRGQLVYDGGVIVNAPGHGRFLKPKRSETELVSAH